jgi:glycine oxidase
MSGARASAAPGRAVVVGGGLIGLAVADALAVRGLAVQVVEAGAGAGRGLPGSASAVAAGMLAPVTESELDPPELTRLGFESLARYPGWVADLEARSGLSCGYRREGTLAVALDRDEAADLERLAAILSDTGRAVHAIDARELRRREPRLAARALGGLFVPGDHAVDPRRLLRALATALARGTGRVRSGLPVERVERSGAAWRVRAADVALDADVVVLATGAWGAGAIELPAPLPALRPVKGQLVRLHGEPLLTHVIRTPQVYLVQRESGEIVVGATVEAQGFDVRATAGAVAELLRSARDLVPDTAELELCEVSVGLRPATSDHLPLIGPYPGLAGLYLAMGHYRNGVLLAPATARLLAEAICGGAAEALRPFACDRPSLSREAFDRGAPERR